MSNAPLMPMATAVWLVENTTLTFKQIADFCKFMKLKFKVLQMEKLPKELKLTILLLLDNYQEKKSICHLKMKIGHCKL